MRNHFAGLHSYRVVSTEREKDCQRIQSTRRPFTLRTLRNTRRPWPCVREDFAHRAALVPTQTSIQFSSLRRCTHVARSHNAYLIGVTSHHLSTTSRFFANIVIELGSLWVCSTKFTWKQCILWKHFPVVSRHQWFSKRNKSLSVTHCTYW